MTGLSNTISEFSKQKIGYFSNWLEYTFNKHKLNSLRNPIDHCRYHGSLLHLILPVLQFLKLHG